MFLVTTLVFSNSSTVIYALSFLMALERTDNLSKSVLDTFRIGEIIL